MEIPFFSSAQAHAEIRSEIMDFWTSFYDSNWYILGDTLHQFEQQYAAFNAVRHAIGVANGLDALQIALRALGIGPGDEILVPSNTYIASWLSVSNCGARPIPVEPDPNTWNIDPDQLEAAITPQTKAIMPVHLYGQACQMDRILALAETHQLFVIEDNAQAHGALFKGRLTGSFGHINATSFYPTKNLGALGDAGALTTDDDELADFAFCFRNYGSKVKYFNDIPGVNSRLDTLQAGVLSIKLAYLQKWNRQRAEIAATYLKLLADVEGLQLPAIAPGATSVWHIFLVLTPERDGLRAWLSDRGIQTMIHYPVPPHLQKAYATTRYRIGQFPIAERIARECLSLPMYPGLELEKVEWICSAIRAFFCR
ncbi:MAG: DegT/DnrJ/EryC1/StrS family aminotransferase [Saprospiraceae bacterium]